MSFESAESGMYRISTTVHDKTIRQDITSPIGGMVTRWALDTSEPQIREALIKLGWTPPADERR